MQAHSNPLVNPRRLKLNKSLFIALAAILVLVVIWFGTVFLQKPPQYPSAQMDINKYFDEYQPDYSITKAGLIQDVDALVAFTEELHADPYRMVTQKAFLEKAEEIKSRIRTIKSDEISALDAFYYLQELAAFVQDGHTTLFPQNWERTVDSMFPLTFTSIDERIFVKDNYGENDIPERAEILAVNGISIEQMVDDVMKYVPGTLPDLKDARFAEQLSLFIQTYYKMSSPWRITYKYNGTVATTTLQGITQDSFDKSSSIQKDYIESEIVVDGKTVPVLEFVGFGDGEWDDFKTFIDDFFARNKDKQCLIIDVRHHPGGEGDWGYYVLSHLISAPLNGPDEFSFKVSQLNKQVVQYGVQSAYYDTGIPQFLWGLPLYKLIQQDDPYYWIYRGILESNIGTFYYAKWENEKPFLANEADDRFQGKVFLLTSHETFSAGVVFSGLFKSNNLGTIVGRETGGRVYMESDMRPVFLPNSNLMYLIPVARLIVNNDNPDRGVMPDIIVDLVPEDYVNHRDKDIEQVIELIKAHSAAVNSDPLKMPDR
jgi:C-terminal processing protease CtpA/Prc